MRRLALLLAAGLALGACGAAERPGDVPRVRLKLAVPADGGSIRAEMVSVRGTVSPADAAVSVGGESAQVSGGEFVAQVALVAGGNVIDVVATAPGRRPAADAVRVMRDMRVEVPVLTDTELDAALEELEKLGLRATEERGGTWLDRFIPGAVAVCATEPPAGTLVDPRSRVTLQTARDCAGSSG